MGIDMSIIAKHPTLVQPKLVGEQGRAGTIIEVLTDGAGKCYDFFGGWLAHKLYSVYTFKFLQAAANAVKGTGQCMSCWVLNRCGIIKVCSSEMTRHCLPRRS